MLKTRSLPTATVAASVLLSLTVACAPMLPPAPRVKDITTADGVVLKATRFAARTGGPAVLLLKDYPVAITLMELNAVQCPHPPNTMDSLRKVSARP